MEISSKFEIIETFIDLSLYSWKNSETDCEKLQAKLQAFHLVPFFDCWFKEAELTEETELKCRQTE